MFIKVEHCGGTNILDACNEMVSLAKFLTKGIGTRTIVKADFNGCKLLATSTCHPEDLVKEYSDWLKSK